jgi:hypothetical protein
MTRYVVEDREGHFVASADNKKDAVIKARWLRPTETLIGTEIREGRKYPALSLVCFLLGAHYRKLSSKSDAGTGELGVPRALARAQNTGSFVNVGNLWLLIIG